VTHVTQEENDKQKLVPILTHVMASCGETLAMASADSGHFSEAAVTADALRAIDLYVVPDRLKHGGARGWLGPRARHQDRCYAR
jgi:hypothetical protein